MSNSRTNEPTINHSSNNQPMQKSNEPDAAININKKFVNKVNASVIQYKAKHPNLETVEFNYCLCWGHISPDAVSQFIVNVKENIENIKAFIQQENNALNKQEMQFGKKTHRFILKVRLYNNKKNPDVVKECNKLAADLLTYLRNNNELIEDIEEWRKTDRTRAIAEASFMKYYEEPVIKNQLDPLLKDAAEIFLKNHPEEKIEASFEHTIVEAIDILALLKPNKTNPNIKAEDALEIAKMKNKYTIILSEHKLSKLMYRIITDEKNEEKNDQKDEEEYKLASELRYDNSGILSIYPMPTRVNNFQSKSSPIEIKNTDNTKEPSVPRQKNYSKSPSSNLRMFAPSFDGSKSGNSSSFSNSSEESHTSSSEENSPNTKLELQFQHDRYFSMFADKVLDRLGEARPINGEEVGKALSSFATHAAHATHAATSVSKQAFKKHKKEQRPQTANHQAEITVITHKM